MIKYINKFILVAVVVLMAGCQATELDELLDNPNGVTPETADVNFFFNAIQLDFALMNVSIADLTMPYTRMMAMTGGNVYENALTPDNGSLNFVWRTAYAGIFPDVDAMIPLAQESGLTTHIGAAKVMKAYTMITLVDLFGAVPYTEAGQGFNNPSPVADSAESVAEAALALLDEAIADLNTPATAAPTTDLFYGGSADNWRKAAKSIKLKYYVNTRLARSNESAVQALITEGDLIESPAEDFQFNAGLNRENPDARHPYYAEHYETANGRYLSNYFMWSMFGEKEVEDPRLRYYFYRQDCDVLDEDQFTLDCVFPEDPDPTARLRPLHYTGPYPFCVASLDGYWGRDHGNNDGIPPDGSKRTVFGLYPAGGSFDAGQCAGVKNGGTDGAGGAGIVPIMMSSYVEFLKAEAAMMMGAGDAAAALEAGVRESISKVQSFGALNNSGVDMSLVASDSVYVAYVMDAFNNADGPGKMDIIMKEYHIASWGNGIEAYNNYRRTGFPSGMQPTRDEISGEFPRSLVYPADYVNLNANASQKTITDQIFWDTNPAGFIE